MNLIGDLERLFATSLYPNRVPIAVALVVMGVLLLVLARRRGWFAAARRHPGRTAAVVVIALAVGLPSAWYLGSPLFIRTALNEPGPIASATPSPSTVPGASGSAAPGASGPAPSAASTNPPLANGRTGQFTGADEFHFGSGSATLIESAPGAWTIRFENFSVRNGPDLYVYVSTDASGYTDGAIEVGALRATDGNFNMDLPLGVVPDGAASIVIWCKQFAVQFAVAPLAG
ncbi:MAG: DM13 domain-containing protein [Chloroflexota bacterium]